MIKKVIRKIVPYPLRFLFNPLLKFILYAEFRQRARYSKHCKREQVNQQVILYEAYHGGSMTGNPYAVFTYLLDHPEYQHFHHIWAMVDEGDASSVSSHPRVTIVKYQGREYIRYLATAKYLMNNTSFPAYFNKRRGQIYANIWHGTPLKTMGMDIKQRGFADHKNIQRNFLFSDYFVSSNQYTYDKLLKSYDIYTLFNGSVLDTGYPRVDLMFKANKETIRRDLGITKDKQIVLYAPTWRGFLGKEENESQRVLDDMEEIQGKCPDKLVLLKAHYYTETFFKEKGLGHWIVPNKIDTNELLSVVDILITDYSSVFFDFLPSKRPIIFYAYDEEEYQTVRGTYLSMNELPGPLCHHVSEVIDSIQNMDVIAARYQGVYEQFIEEFCYHDDGSSAKRLVDAVFEGKPSRHLFKIKNNKKKILMYGGGFLNNGITASVVNLLNMIDYDKFNVTLIDHGTNIKASKRTHMQKVNENVHHIFRFGTWNASLVDLYRHQFFFKSGRKEMAPVDMYQKEMVRLTGLTEFDIGIDFGGYSPFWATLFAYGDFTRKSIYLHSDMDKELDKKVNDQYPHRQNLKVIFSLYDHFDKVISVSKLVHDQNKRNIEQFIKNPKQKMDYVINAIDYRRILSMSDQDADFQYEFGEELTFESASLPEYSDMKRSGDGNGRELFPMPNRQETNFITVGRLSPEKDHEKLIQAFYDLTKHHLDVRLYIVGEGALKEPLRELVSTLNLDEKVILTGQLNNPYPLLSRCDCFVLSSNYEGQAIVLLEALILDVPVITTDVPGPRSVIEDGYGLIVNNTRDGLNRGMQQFLNGNPLNERKFDYKAYQQDAIDMFYNKVCDTDK